MPCVIEEDISPSPLLVDNACEDVVITIPWGRRSSCETLYATESSILICDTESQLRSTVEYVYLDDNLKEALEISTMIFEQLADVPSAER